MAVRSQFVVLECLFQWHSSNKLCSRSIKLIWKEAKSIGKDRCATLPPLHCCKANPNNFCSGLCSYLFIIRHVFEQPEKNNCRNHVDDGGDGDDGFDVKFIPCKMQVIVITWGGWYCYFDYYYNKLILLLLLLLLITIILMINNNDHIILQLQPAAKL